MVISQNIILQSNISYNCCGSYLVREGEIYFLTNSEARLINYLINNANRKVQIKELLNYLEDSSNATLTEYNVYMLIYRLRKKLEVNHKRPKILRNHRPGYIFLIKE
ncbi:DNA-binding transcriptional activator KdpE [compost metagenome]